MPMEQVSENPGAAAEIGHPRTRPQFGNPHAGFDQPHAAFGRKHIVAVCGGVAVEEVDLFLLVLGLVFLYLLLLLCVNRNSGSKKQNQSCCY